MPHSAPKIPPWMQNSRTFFFCFSLQMNGWNRGEVPLCCYSPSLEWQLTNWIFLEDDIITESYHSHVFVSLQKCPRNNMIKAIKILSYLKIFKVVDNIVLCVSEASSWTEEMGEFFFPGSSVSSPLTGWKGIVRGQRKKNWMERERGSVVFVGREGNDSQTKLGWQMFKKSVKAHVSSKHKRER